MIVLSWNVRGLNNGPRQKVVRDMIRNHSPDVLLLQETKLTMDSMMGLVPKLWGRGECQCVGAAGSSGGVAYLGNPLRFCPIWWVASRSSLTRVLASLETGEFILFSNIYAPTDF